MSRPNALLADGYLTHHHHKVLTRPLPGIVPVQQHVQGYLISKHTGEVLVEMIRNWEEKACVRERAERKIVPDLLETNLNYLLHLRQVAEHT